MFSSDVAKIKVAELKAKGDAGTIQRLRKSCDDAAAIMEHAANMLTGKTLAKEYRLKLAGELFRGAGVLRGLAQFSPPKGAK